MKILITGVAGFIGFHTATRLLENKKNSVYGVDNLNDYYDVNIKKDRLSYLKKRKNFIFYKVDINNQKKIKNIVIKNKITHIINLAAQAGVLYSIENPRKYLDTNIIGFYNLLEVCRDCKISHLIYASTSSVYGDNSNFPLREDEPVNKPLSFYAATKISNEVMAHSFSNVYGVSSTGLRFFTVFGPFGRPDMALFKFTKAILSNEYVTLFNKGKHVRDFTYIDDVVDVITKLVNKPPKSDIPHDIFNVGSSNPQELKKYLKEIETFVGKKAKIKKAGLQKGDIEKTHADISKINKKIKFKPKFNIKIGIKNFVDWFQKYYY